MPSKPCHGTHFVVSELRALGMHTYLTLQHLHAGGTHCEWHTRVVGKTVAKT